MCERQGLAHSSLNDLYSVCLTWTTHLHLMQTRAGVTTNRFGLIRREIKERHSFLDILGERVVVRCGREPKQMG